MRAATPATAILRLTSSATVATIRSSVGVSLLWQSPMGPLRFDYAWALTKDDADETQGFRFSGGGKF